MLPMLLHMTSLSASGWRMPCRKANKGSDILFEQATEGMLLADYRNKRFEIFPTGKCSSSWVTRKKNSSS